MSRTMTMSIAVVIAIAVVGYFFLPDIKNLFTMEDSQQQNTEVASSTASTVADAAQTTSTAVPTAPNELIIQDELVGTGQVATKGDTLTVNYTGKFQDGTIFDTSVGKAPFQFVLGAGMVIKGWDQGFDGMKVGGKRLLIVPPSLGYGAGAVGPIPPNSTLVFEVELLKVTSAANTAPIPEGPHS